MSEAPPTATAAMLAAKQGREEQLKVLQAYERGEEVTFRNHQARGFTCVSDPTVFSRTRSPAKINFTRTAVFLDAAAQNDEELVEKLIAEGMDCNVSNADGLTALHQCCIENNLKLASTLVLKGADINARDNDWWTPLHAAAACGHWRVVNFLLSNNANILAVNADGDLPIDIAEGDKVTNILQEELNRRELKDQALEDARKRAEVELMETVKTMVSKGESVSQPDRCGVTPMHVAACNGWVEVLEFCISNKGDVNAQDEDGNTPLHLATFFLQYKAVEILAKAGASVDAVNRHLETALVLTEDVTMIRLLKAIKNHQAVEAASSGDDRNRLNSSVKRKSLAQKADMAKSDTKLEGSTNKSNYAEISFGDRKTPDDASPNVGRKKPAGQEQITYAVLDLGKGKGGSEETKGSGEEAVYAQPVKKAPPKISKGDKQYKGSLAAIALNEKPEGEEEGASPSPAGAAAAAPPATSPSTPAVPQQKPKGGCCIVS